MPPKLYTAEDLERVADRVRTEVLSDVFQKHFDKFEEKVDGLYTELSRRVERIEAMNLPELSKKESAALPKIAQAYLFGVDDGERRKAWWKTWSGRLLLTIGGLEYLHQIGADAAAWNGIRSVFH